jgi:hypothetical protein
MTPCNLVYIFTSVLEEPAASVFIVEMSAIQGWESRTGAMTEPVGAPKLHGILTQKTNLHGHHLEKLKQITT